jgi:hypothetical protein
VEKAETQCCYITFLWKFLIKKHTIFKFWILREDYLRTNITAGILDILDIFWRKWRISVIWAELSVKSVHSAESKKVTFIKWILWFQIGRNQCLNPPFYSAHYNIGRMDKNVDNSGRYGIFIYQNQNGRVIYTSIRNFEKLKKNILIGEKRRKKPSEPQNGIWGHKSVVVWYIHRSGILTEARKYSVRDQKAKNCI